MYTTTEAATILGIKTQTVARHIQRKVITAEKRGRDYLITDEELDRFKRERKGRGRPRKQEEQTMNDQTINSTVRYQGKLIGNVTIHLTGAGTGRAIMGGRTRKVVFRQATQGSRKGTMLWHCDDVD